MVTDFFYYFDTKENSLFDIRYDYGTIVESKGRTFTGIVYKNLYITVDLFRIRFTYNMVWDRKDVGYEEAYKQYHGKYPRKARRHSS